MTDRLRDIERAGGIQFLTGRGESVGFYRGPKGTMIVRSLGAAMHLEHVDVPLSRVDMLSLQSFIEQVMLEGAEPVVPFAQLPEALQRLRRNGFPPCLHPSSHVGPDGICQYCGEQALLDAAADAFVEHCRKQVPVRGQR